MKKYSIILIVFLALLCLSGCKSPEEELNDFISKDNTKKETKSDSSLIGSWDRNNMVYTFNEDGSCTYDMNGRVKNCNYETNKGEITITFESGSTPYVSSYKIEDDKLILKDSSGTDDIFIKKK